MLLRVHLHALNLRVRQGLRQVGLDHAQLVAFLIGEVFAARVLVLVDGLPVLPGELIQHREDAGVVELYALVDFPLLDGGRDHPEDGQLVPVLVTHGLLDVPIDAILEATHDLKKINDRMRGWRVNTGGCAGPVP